MIGKLFIPAVIFFLAVASVNAQLTGSTGKEKLAPGLQITQQPVTTSRTLTGEYLITNQSGNETYFDVILDHIPDTTITVITATYNNTKYKDEHPLSLSTDITYVKDLQLPITINNEPPSAVMATLEKSPENKDVKYETGDMLYFRYLADSDTDYFIKLGDSSIEIIQNSSIYDLNHHENTATFMSNFTHLLPSTADPYDSLVLYYSFDHDKNYSGTSYDISRNDIDADHESATYVGVTDIKNVYGQSLYCNGATNANIETEVHPALNANQSITICLWSWKASTSASQFLFGKHGATYEYALYSRGNELFDFYGSEGDIDMTKKFTPQDWVHLCISNNETSTLFVINGSTYESFKYDPMNGTVWNEPLAICSWGSSPNYYFGGFIDDFMIFNKSLSLEQMQAIYNNQSSRYTTGNMTTHIMSHTGNYNRVNISMDYIGNDMGSTVGVKLASYNFSDQLLLWYSFDRDDGLTAIDDSGNGHDGQYSNTVVDSINRFNFGNSTHYYGDASDSYIMAGNDSNMFGWVDHQHMTVSLWFMPTTVANYDTMFSYSYTNAGTHVRLRMYDNVVMAFLGTESYSSSVPLVANNVYFVALTYDPVTDYVNLTVNDVTDGFTDTTGIDANPLADLIIGGFHDGGDDVQSFFYGFIDEVMVWNRTLSAQEIANLYKYGKDTVYFTDYQNITEAYKNYTFKIDPSTKAIATEFLLQPSQYDFYTPYVGGNISYVFFNGTEEGPDETPPTVTFSALTDNNETVTANYSYVDVDLDETGDTCLLEWNGTNETMTGSGTDYYVNKTLLVNGNYTFQAYCNDTAGNLGQSLTRWVYINWTAPVPGAEEFCWSLTAGQLAIPKGCEVSIREELAI